MHYEADEAYKQFNSRLVQSKYEMVGVRVPVLKKLAKQLVQTGDWQRFIQQQPKLYEDIMLRGFVISTVSITVEERQQLIEQHFQWLDNWQTVDSLCSSLKETKRNEKQYWEWLMDVREQQDIYTIRFVIVMYLTYFLTPVYLAEVLNYLQSVQSEEYYIKMAIAWALSMAYVKHPEPVTSFLEQTKLDRWTYNKAIQKIIESRQISEEIRQMVKTWKK